MFDVIYIYIERLKYVQKNHVHSKIVAYIHVINIKVKKIK